MNTSASMRRFALALAAAALATVTACSALKPAPVAPPTFFALDGGGPAAPAVRRAPSSGSSAAAPTLLVNPPQAAAGFDSQRIVYLRRAHQLEYFAHSEWVDAPAHMLAPLIVTALDRAGPFRAVVSTPTSASADLRLDTEIVRLQHDFGTTPSHVRLTLRATLTDNATREVLAQADLDHRADAASEDAYGGVLAAHRATAAALQALAALCSEAAGQWQARESTAPRRAVGRR